MKNSHLDRRTKYSQKMMKDALIGLLEENDLNEITVTDICSTADVNRGTFYRYYRDVDDLFNQIEEEFTERIFRLFPELGSGEDGSWMNESVLEKALLLILENKDFVRVVQKGNTTSRMVKNILMFIQPYFVRLIRDSVQEITEEETAYMFEFMIGGTTNAFVKWINDDMEVPIERMQKILMKMIASALSMR